MPGSGGRFGVKEPPPAAITTILHSKHGAGVGGEAEAVARALQRLDPLAEMELGAEGLDLLHEPVGQLLPGDHGEARDVVDRLLGIELGALAARPVEDVDHMRLHVDEAELEDGEQAHGACAHDHGIGLDHILRTCVSRGLRTASRGCGRRGRQALR